MRTLEQNAVERFNAWYADAVKRWPQLAHVPQNMLLSAFYSGIIYQLEQEREEIRKKIEGLQHNDR